MSYGLAVHPDRKFVCRRCGRCCHGDGRVWLLPPDVDVLAAALGLTVMDFTDRYTRLDASRRGLILRDAPDGACIFLDADNVCAVQDAKPLQCRKYPLAWQNSDTAAACPGLTG